MEYIGRDNGAAALIYCILKEKVTEQGLAWINDEKSKHLPAECTLEMIELYKQGLELQEIGEIFGLEKTGVFKRMKKHLGYSISSLKELRKQKKEGTN